MLVLSEGTIGLPSIHPENLDALISSKLLLIFHENGHMDKFHDRDMHIIIIYYLFFYLVTMATSREKI